MRTTGMVLLLSILLVVCAIAPGPGWPGQAVARAEASGPQAGAPALAEAGIEGAAHYYQPGGNRPISVSATPYARMNIIWDTVDGWYGPNVTVRYTVTTADGKLKGTGQGVTRPDGWLDGVGCDCDIALGDQVHVTSSAGLNALLAPLDFGGQIDVANDRVSGQIAGGVLPSTGTVLIWSEGRQQTYPPNDSPKDISFAADGRYSADFAGQFDIHMGDTAEVWYNDAHGNQIGTVLKTLRIDVNYAQKRVMVETKPQIALTVDLPGQGSVTGTADGDGWYFTPGLNEWTPPVKDIAPGDRVSVTGGGYAATVDQIGQITGAVDLVADTIEGAVTAPGFTDPLYVKCEVWTKSGPSGVGVTVQSAGGRYLCDFHPVGQLAAGQTIAVRYLQPDGNAVINIFLAYDHTLYLPLVRR